MTVEIRRSSARFQELVPGRATWHSLSFGAYYDPERTAIGTMVCHDEHLLATGEGFTEHAHEGVDIVTYVVSGALAHSDSLGSSGVLEAGELGWLRASSAVRHSEIAAAPATRFVQVWLQQYDGEPAWQRIEGGRLSLPGGSLEVVRLGAGETASLPAGGLVHVFVASGALLRNSLAEPLSAGDALLLDSEPAREVGAAVPTTLLVWTLAALPASEG
ncbi:pirin family protein [Nocardioides sp. Kera G14]|uniref:pirin family protein n=1 Tax=Nocardioides sp. Kera G14 TaxID=2884264 RepID=UPI001D121D6F|nr:pirin family protein [Nocardioides sp. Kera G14]UDY23516.1 pirin family protein [Nocardioides sp. Kera G14]